MRSTDDFKDFRTLDESREKAQMTKKGAVVGGCYRNCKPSECAAAQDLLLQVEKREIAEMVTMVLNRKTIGVELSNDSNYTGAVTRGRGSFKGIQFNCSNECKGNKCYTCLAQALT